MSNFRQFIDNGVTTATAKYAMPQGTIVSYSTADGKLFPTFGQVGNYSDFPAGCTFNWCVCVNATTYTYVFIYAVSTTGYVRAATYDTDTHSWTFGDAVSLGASTDTQTSVNVDIICAIDTDKFAVAYLDGSSYPTAIVGTLSGTTITLGSASIAKSQASYSVAITSLTTDKFVVAYSNNTTQVYGRVATVSTTTISWGTEKSYPAITSAAIKWTSIAKTYTDEFVLYVSGAECKYVVIASTVSTTTITCAAAWTQVDSNTGARAFCTSFGNDRIFICTSGSPNVTTGTISGTVITMGTASSTMPTTCNRLRAIASGVYSMDRTTAGAGAILTVTGNVISIAASLTPNGVTVTIPFISGLLFTQNTTTLAVGIGGYEHGSPAGVLMDDSAVDTECVVMWKGGMPITRTTELSATTTAFYNASGVYGVGNAVSGLYNYLYRQYAIGHLEITGYVV